MQSLIVQYSFSYHLLHFHILHYLLQIQSGHERSDDLEILWLNTVVWWWHMTKLLIHLMFCPYFCVEVSIAVHILEVPGLNFGWVLRYPNRDFHWFSSWDLVATAVMVQTNTASSHMLQNFFLIWHRINTAVETVTKFLNKCILSHLYD
jgi:hypothetical protein